MPEISMRQEHHLVPDCQGLGDEVERLLQARQLATLGLIRSLQTHDCKYMRPEVRARIRDAGLDYWDVLADATEIADLKIRLLSEPEKRLLEQLPNDWEEHLLNDPLFDPDESPQRIRS